MNNGLSDKQLKEIVNVLSQYKAVEQSVLFGSRAMGSYKKGSDVDITIMGKNADFTLASKIKSHLEDDTYLPYFFDVISYNTIKSDELKEHIRKYGKVILSGGNTIPKGWVETTLGEVCEIKYGKDHKHLGDGNIPCYGSGGLMRKVDTILYNKSSVLIPRKGTLSNLFFIKESFWTVDTLFYTIIDEKKIEPLFLFYKLKTYNLENLNVGSAVPSLTTAVLNQFPFEIPKNINEQKSIAQILTAFDDKIELLQAQNKTLETTAQTIFKEWFGKYQIGDDLPVGWRLGKLEEVLEIKYGKDHKHLKDGQFPLYGSGGIMRYVEKSLYDKDSILIPRKGTLSNLFYLNEPFWSVDTMFYSKITHYFQGRFIFLFLKSIDLSSMNVGSAVPSLTTQVLNQIPIVIPKDEIVIEFDKMVSSVYVKIQENNSQIQTLKKTRDTLLPKLMSGELRWSGENVF